MRNTKIAPKFFDRNDNEISAADVNSIRDWWSSFRPGWPGYTYEETGQRKTVVMINPTTKEETVMYKVR